jgi:hypothetical protein
MDKVNILVVAPTADRLNSARKNYQFVDKVIDVRFLLVADFDDVRKVSGLHFAMIVGLEDISPTFRDHILTRLRVFIRK